MASKRPLNIFREDVVFEELGNCRCCKFIAFKHLQMPFRHTGFLLYFDNVPKYTINVRTEEDTWAQYLQSLVVAPGRITVESVNDLGQVQFVGRPVVRVMECKADREAARQDLVILLTPETRYAVLWRNCRDHVRGVLANLEGRHPGMAVAARQELRQTHWEDVSFIAGLIAVAISMARVVALVLRK